MIKLLLCPTQQVLSSKMTDTPEHFPHLTIEQRTRNGIGSFEFTFSEPALDDLLQTAGVHSVAELSDHTLRQLCDHFGERNVQRVMDELEEETPGSVAINNEVDGAGLGSDEIGYDLARRFLPQTEDSRELLFDPQYSPVQVEINVFDPSDLSKHSTDIRKISARVLEITLQPPSLA
jgi:hypothetical protein